MSSRELISLLHSSEEYVDKVFKETVEPIRLGICRELDFELRPYQKEFSDRLIKATLRAKNEEIAILMARQIGKTSVTAISVLSLIVFYLSILGENFKIGWFAPAQSTSIMVARQRVIEYANAVAGYLNSFNVVLVKGYGRERVGHSSPLLSFRNESNGCECHIRSLSANPKSNIKGDTLDLTIIEDCFPYDAKILTNLGWVKIGDIVEQGKAEEVLSYNEKTQVLEWKSITNRMTKYVDDLMKIIYDGGYVVCTPTHKFLTNKGWKEAQDLNNTKVQLLGYDTRTNRASDTWNFIRRHFNRISEQTSDKRKNIWKSWIQSAGICKVENVCNQQRFQNKYGASKQFGIWRYFNKILNRMSSIFYQSLLEFNKKWKEMYIYGISKMVDSFRNSSMVYGRWFNFIKRLQYIFTYPVIFRRRKQNNSTFLSGQIRRSKNSERQAIPRNIIFYQTSLYSNGSNVERHSRLCSFNNASQMARATSEMCDMFKIIPSFSYEQTKCMFKRMFKGKNEKNQKETLSKKEVFDLTIVDNHNFFVKFGNNQPILAHNCQEVDEDKMHNDIFPMASKGAPILLSGVPVPEVERMNKYYIETITRNPRGAWLSSVDWKRACGYRREELEKLDAWNEGDEECLDDILAYENGSDSYRYYLKRQRDYILKMRKRLLLTNPQAFLSQYELKWFTWDNKPWNMEQIVQWEKEYVPDKERLRFWGLDIAKVNDSTVGFVLERYLGEHHIVGLYEHQGSKDYPTQSREVLPWLKPFMPLRYGFMDITGAGEGFIDNFKQELYKESREVIDGIGSFDGFDFRKREDVNAMFQQLCMDIHAGTVHYDRRNVNVSLLNRFMEQMDTVYKVYHGHYLWLESGNEKEHDDYVTSLALSRYASLEKSQKMGVVTIEI